MKCSRTRLNCWNINWSYEIVIKSDGAPVWTAGTSTGVVETYIKVFEDRFGLMEYQLELWNRL